MSPRHSYAVGNGACSQSGTNWQLSIIDGSISEVDRRLVVAAKFSTWRKSKGIVRFAWGRDQVHLSGLTSIGRPHRRCELLCREERSAKDDALTSSWDKMGRDGKALTSQRMHCSDFR